MTEYSSEMIDLIKKNTSFKTDERAKAVIETLIWLENGAPEKFDGLPGKYHFDMACFVEDMAYLRADDDETVPSCGTVCCIAGAIHAFEQSGLLEINKVPAMGRIFDIDDFELQNLFLCTGTELHMHEITPSGAAKTLNRYIQTGRVRWFREEQVSGE